MDQITQEEMSQVRLEAERYLASGLHALGISCTFVTRLIDQCQADAAEVVKLQAIVTKTKILVDSAAKPLPSKSETKEPGAK